MKHINKKSPLYIIDGHTSLEERGIGTKTPKTKGRVVLRGDIVKDDSGAFAVFIEQGYGYGLGRILQDQNCMIPFRCRLY